MQQYLIIKAQRKQIQYERKKEMKDAAYDPMQDLIAQGRKICKISSNFKKRRWSPKEEGLYLYFLVQNKELFGENQNLKKNRAFKKMSKRLVRRNSHQCRSHHQKMLIKYGSLEKIILNIQQNLKDTDSIKVNIEDLKIKKAQNSEEQESNQLQSYQYKSKQQYFLSKKEYIPDSINELNFNIWQTINQRTWIQPYNSVIQKKEKDTEDFNKQYDF